MHSNDKDIWRKYFNEMSKYHHNIKIIQPIKIKKLKNLKI